jgi:hypothetical protein
MRIKLILLCAVVCAIAFGQTASYPSGIADDTNLKVTKNGVKTVLRAAAYPGDSVITVADCSKLAANMLLTLGKTEIVSVVSVSGAGAGCNLTVARGFDGTTAAAHGTGAEVAQYPTAWERNSLKSEIIAIESALGPGLSNVLGTGAAVNSVQYDFAAQFPGGSLIAGANTVTLAPVPAGVSGTFTGHPLYVSGGTGVAEACTISGGSGVAGQSSGQIILTCANTHSGSWSIRSATAGIQEAHDALGSTGGTIRVNATGTTIPLYATINLSKEGARLMCDSMSRPLAMNAGVLVNITAGSVEVGGCGFQGNRAPGNVAIQVGGIRDYIHDIRLDLLYGGIKTTGGFHHKIVNVWGRNLAAYMIKHSAGVSPFIDTVTYATDQGYEVPSEGGIVINASGAYIYNTDILLARNGILIEPGTDGDVTWTFVYDARFDQNFHAGVNIRNANPTYAVRGVFLHDVWSATTGVGLIDDYSFQSLGVGVGSNDGIGLVIGEGLGTIQDVVVDGGEIFNNRYQNVKIFAGDKITLNGIKLLENNLGSGTSGSIDNVYIAANGRVDIVGCDIRGAAPTKPDLRAGVLLSTTTINAVIRDSRFAGTFTGGPVHDLANYPGSSVRVMGFNPGMDDAAQTIASASTLAIPPRGLITVSGTATVDTINQGWAGRHVILNKTDSGTLTFSSSGNIVTGFTLVSGEQAVCDFAATKWVCHK